MPEEPKLSKINMVLMLSVALLIDFMLLFSNLLFLLPVVGAPIAYIISFTINIYAGLLFLIWFLILRIPLFKPRRAIAMASGWIIGLIPILSIAPAWTLAIIIMVTTKTFRDKVGSPKRVY